MSKKGTKTILVCGATGRQGGASAKLLHESGFNVRALTRDPDQAKARRLIGPGIELVRGDMEDRSALSRVAEGVYGVHSVQDSHGPGGSEGEVRQGENVADAAKRSGVAHFIYSSVASADQQTGIPHFESKFRIEQHIRGTGMRYTILRPAFFMENWGFMRESIDHGALSLPLKASTRLQMIAVDDIGGMVVQAFQHTGKWQDRIFELAGDELSMGDIAGVFTRATGREVRYQQIPWDEFEQKAGQDMTTMYRWFESTGYHIDISAVRQEYPRLTSFEQWINRHWHAAQGAAR